ncbi:SDR family oxidoreductase [Sphingopyxis kveilinensis]|uniref:SDR family oxidoreductase n=1 Tax=Sphingopyxis kveilinensis TaxID=3114367 RepID=UPI0030D46C8B
MNNRIALVTGASSGAGRAIALHLHKRGFIVYGTSRGEVRPDPFKMLQLDVRIDASVEAAISTVLEREGRIDLLVNNAGVVLVAGVEETSPANVLEMLDVNALGAFRMMRAVLPGMRRRNSGHIINVSSLSGVIGYPYLSAYAASKHALEAISECLRFELFDTDVRVSIVQPDGMRTGISFAAPASDHPVVGPRRRALLARLEHATTDGGTDPAALARKVWELVESAEPALRTPLGLGAERLIMAKHSLSPTEFEKLIVDDVHAGS